jgi:hypothetical protein
MDSNAIAQWAHDIRNTLGTVALYLETLDRQADTIRILARSDALLKTATSVCSDLMREARQSGMKMPRLAFDVTRTIEEVVELAAVVPAATTLHLVSGEPV